MRSPIGFRKFKPWYSGLREWAAGPPTPPPEACDLETFQIFFDGSGQTTTLSGTNDSIVTATSNGTTNTESVMGALNTVFKANANPIVWLGEATVTAQDIPEVTTDSLITFVLQFNDTVAQNNIAGVIAAWRNGSDVNKLQDQDDNTNLADIDLSNGFKVGMYYDSVAGKVYAALDSETTFELTIQNAITLENNKVLTLNVYAGNIEDTSISVQFNQFQALTLFRHLRLCLGVKLFIMGNCRVVYKQVHSEYEYTSRT
jgi:hypothetical protein